MSIFLADMWDAARRLRRSVGLLAASTALLATAVGGSTAMFAVVYAVVLKPLPVADEAALVSVHLTRDDTPRGPLPLPLVLDLRANAGAFSGMAAYFQWSANLTNAGDAERLQGMRVSGDYFPMLGGRAARGRLPGADDTAPGAAAVAVISDGLWTRRFGRSEAIVGQQLTLNGERFDIVGVLPQDFPVQIRDVEVIAPWRPETDARRTNPTLAFLRVIGRLKPGITVDQAQSEVVRRSEAYGRTYPQARAATERPSLVHFRDDLTGNPGRVLIFLSIALGLVVAIAAVNLGGLLVAQAARRAPEFAARRALGATPQRIGSQLVAETLVLTTVGAVAGLTLAHLLVSALRLGPDIAFLRAVTVSLTLESALFGGLVAAVITPVAAAMPAWQLSRSRGSAAHRWATARARRIRACVVTAEIAATLVLLVGAGLLVRSFLAVQRVDMGFDPDGVLSVRLSLPRTPYPTTAAITGFADAFADRLRVLPDVKNVAAANVVPMNNYLASSTIRPPGLEALADGSWPDVHYRMVTPAYFSTLGMRIVEGRGFEPSDRAMAQPVAVISRALAARYWPSRTPIGSQVLVRDDGARSRTVTVVGVVGNVRHRGQEFDAPHEIYIPIAQVPDATSVWLANNMYWVVKTHGDPMRLANAVRRELTGLDPGVASSLVRPMASWVDASTQTRRFNLRLLLAFAFTAVLLALVGVYAVNAEAVSAREREFGIRSALGATDRQIRWMALRDGLGPVSAGIVIGAVVALGVTRSIAAFLYEIPPRDPWTFAAVSVLLALAGGAAVYLSLRTLLTVDPVTALRAE